MMIFSFCLKCLRDKLYSKYSFQMLGVQNTLFYIKQSCHSESISRWIEPDGFTTGIDIYNTASRSKVPLKSKHPNLLTWYACGPTVYDSAHLGHGLSYVKCDIMRRILEKTFEIDVIQVMGITDIDDKIINKAKEVDVSTRTIAQKYEEEFFQDMRKLNNLPPLLYVRVTDRIPQIVSFIQALLTKGIAYTVEEGSVYFDTNAFGRYGQLSKVQTLTPTEMTFMKHNDPHKRSPRDFALWKAAKEGEPSWISPFGTGRPGWHIECSSIACSIFGDHLDVHSGGKDLLFPHHENEEVQCQALLDKERWCNYWIHTGHLYSRDETKMSKSLKNTISIQEFLQEYSANSFRLFCLLTPHRMDVDYSTDSLKRTEAVSKRIGSFLRDSQAYIRSQFDSSLFDEPFLLQKLAQVKVDVRKALADDFDTKTATNLLLELISDCNKSLHKDSKGLASVSSSLGTMASINNYVLKILGDFGLSYPQMLSPQKSPEHHTQLPHIMDLFSQFRSDVRNFALLKDEKSLQMNLSGAEQNFLRQDRIPLLQSCDMVREELTKHGIQLKDFTAGDKKTTWGYLEEKPNKTKR